MRNKLQNTSEVFRGSLNIKKVLLVILLVSAMSLVASCGGESKKSESSEGGSKKYDVSLIDDSSGMRIDPATITVKSGENVVLNATNNGTVPHNLTMDDGMATADIAPYASAEFEVGKITEDTQIHCSIAGHKEQGMVLDIKVEK